MATFSRKLWEARMVANFSEISVLPLMTTAPTEMTAESVTFNRAKPATVSEYNGTVNWEDAQTSNVTMTFDHKYYFAVKVDDIDKAQTNIPVLDATVASTTAEMSTDCDVYAYDKYIKGAGTRIVNKVITTDNGVYDAIVDLGVELGKKKVPVSNRYVIIGWDSLGKLQKDSRFTHNPDVLANGIVNGQKINGMNIVVTASIPANTILAIYKGSVGYGQQINELEGMRLQSSFSDGVRGLNVAGALVLNADGVAALDYTSDTSATTAKYRIVDTPATNPYTAGYYELGTDGTFSATADTTVTEGKTYYTTNF